MSLKVLDPGMFSTIQDKGRVGYLKEGVAPSGALDQESFRLANLLVRNDAEEAVIEMIGKGGSFQFEQPALVAVTGAAKEMYLNDKVICPYKSFQVKPQDILSIGIFKEGMCGYLAIHGGIQTESVMGSKSTHTKIGIGGFHGRMLQSKDRITYQATHFLPSPKALHRKQRTSSLKRNIVRVLEGPHYNLFTPKEQQAFFHSDYTITPQSDRMGYRLKGKRMNHIKKAEMISEATVLGGIQIPSDGQPIVLLHDRQTTGGYPMIAVVCSVDLPKFVQIPFGQKVRFQKVSLSEAQQALKEKEERMRELASHLLKEDEVLGEEDVLNLLKVIEKSSLTNFYYKDEKRTVKMEKGKWKE